MTTRTNQPPANMQIITSSDPMTKSLAAAILLEGGVVAIPTDTVYGFAASLQWPKAINRLYDLKARPTSKAIPVLISDLEHVSKLAVQTPPIVTALTNRFWPGALTLVVEARNGLPHQVVSMDSAGVETVAIRLPNHSLARQIIEAAGGALAVTSANRSGEPDAVSAEQVRQISFAKPDAIVDGGRLGGGVPSTIVSVDSSGIEILREGAIPASEVLDTLQSAGFGARAIPGSAV